MSAEPLDDAPEPEPEVAGPHSRLPFNPPELLVARMEDPSFAEVMGRARAKARHEEYRPERHHPYRGVGRRIVREDTEAAANLAEVIARFGAKGAKWRPVEPEREKAVETTRHLRAL